MKKRGEKLQRHYQQALEYWLHLVPNRPEYVVLCNFDEFWIYDLNQQLDEPITAPGLPPCVSDPSPFLTTDRIQPPQPG